LDENSLTTFCRCDGRAKGIAREHQNGFFMRLRMNYSKGCSRRRLTQRVSIDPNLGQSVTISLSECKDIFVRVTRGVSGIPSIYAGMQFSTADLRCGNGGASCHLRILPRSDSNSPALCTRLASDLSQARPKYVFVPYRELAYVTRPHE